MLKAVIDAETLRDAIEAASPLVDEVKFTISDKGLELKAIDPAGVAMVSLRIDASAFEFYQATPGEIGIDLVRLSDLLSMAGRGERVRLELLEDERKLKTGVGSLSYTLGLMDPGMLRPVPRIPELDLPAYVVLPGSEFRRAIKAAEMVSDHVVLGVKDDLFYMEAKGDIDALRLTLQSSELLDMKPGEARSLFSLDYLSDMSRSIGKALKVKLEIGIDYPLRIGFRLNDVHVGYLLAPGIEEEY
ncbi:MAG: DNA polymerase sliding clamp [Candidatus Methanosuratincola sp.]